MDRYKVSGEDLRDFYSPETCLSQVFGDIEMDLQAQGRVVCRYILNGMDLSEADESKFAEIELKDVKTLEYLAEKKSSLVGQVLEAWSQAIPEMMISSEKLCQRMRFQGPKGIFKDLHDLLENVEFLISSLSALKTMAGEEMCHSVPKWQETELNSKKTVQESLQAVEKKDFVLLADILEYDLNNVLQAWSECLNVLSIRIQGAKASNATTNTLQHEDGSDIVVRGRVAH